jgi:hypothetical protein
MAREESFFDDLARGLADGSISRRRALGLFASSAIAALLPSTRALADDDDDDHDGYTVCHVPGRPPNCDCSRARTIRGLSRRERNRHLRNHPCDSRGNCRNNPYCGTTTTTTSTSTSTSTSTTSTSTSTTSTTPPPTQDCTAGTLCAGGQGRCLANASGVGTTCWCAGTGSCDFSGCTRCPTGYACVKLPECEAIGTPNGCVPICPGT